MLVALSAIEFDPEGHVWLDVEPSAVLDADRTRHITRVATLDGGAVFNDFGYSDSDRTIDLVWNDRAANKRGLVERLLRLYGRINVAMPEALYEVAPASFSPGTSETRLRLLVSRRLSA
jgi:hypothetical protein